MTLWTSLGWLAFAVSLVVLAGGVSWLLMRSRQMSAGDMMEDGSWEFSPEDYHCMDGLFAEEDLAFLQSQKGYRPAMGTRWKRERQRLFRLYLSELKLDFRRLHARARAFAAHSDAESADLVGVLMRQEIVFLRAVAGLEFRLLLQRAGVGRVKISPFVELLEAMRLDLAARTPVPAA